MNSSEELDIKYVESDISLHCFTTSIAERIVKFEVLKFVDSIYLWIGDKRNRTFQDLSLALNSKVAEQTIATKIMGTPTDMTSSAIANKLSKKLNKPVYVSFNLVDDRLTVPFVYKRINEEIKENPQFF